MKKNFKRKMMKVLLQDNKSKNIWKMFNTSNNSLSCGFCRCLMEVCVILEALYKKKNAETSFQ